MQKLFLGILIVTGLITLQACQKEIDFGTGSSVTGNFKAKIDGTQWIANSVTGATRINGLINITGRSVDKKLITFTLTDSGVHNYILDDVSRNVAAYQDSSMPNVNALSTNQGINPGDAGGNVRITSIDTTNKKISGTFSFKVFRMMDGLQRTITEGSFTNLSYSLTLPPGNASDTFNVKIAGSSWIPPVITGITVPPAGPTGANLAISASDATGAKSMGLVFPANITPGTYPLTMFGPQIGLYNPDLDPTHSQVSKVGVLVILSHNTGTKRIRGTFLFTGETILPPILTTQITEGFFAVTYQ